jgi:ABC-2 type transport system permease protein
MKKNFLVLKFEFVSVVTRRSFLIALVLLPVVGFLVTLVVKLIQNSPAGQETVLTLQDLFSPNTNTSIEGYVDDAGLIKIIPENIRTQLIPFANEEDVRKALADNEISAFYILPKQFLANGDIIYIRPDFNPIAGATRSAVFTDLVNLNLVEGDRDLHYRLINPINVDTVLLTSEPQRDRNNALTFFIPYGITMLFYFVIMGSASMMLANITTEKSNRMIEMLMTSVTPTQLLTGKIIALGLAGLFQTFVWTFSGYLLLNISGATFNLPVAFQLPISIVFWGLIFFALGYALYASLMAGVGALVPGLREASQATIMMIIPLMIPLVLISTLTQDPNGTLAVILSLFPLTAPVTMMTRLAATHVPVWQTGLSVVLLFLTVIFFIRGIAGLFRAQNLLTGQSFKLRVFFKAMSGKEKSR